MQKKTQHIYLCTITCKYNIISQTYFPFISEILSWQLIFFWNIVLFIFGKISSFLEYNFVILSLGNWNYWGKVFHFQRGNLPRWCGIFHFPDFSGNFTHLISFGEFIFWSLMSINELEVPFMWKDDDD